MKGDTMRLICHSERGRDCGTVLAKSLEKIAPQTRIVRDWDEVIGHLESRSADPVDVVIDLIGRDGRGALRHLRELWESRLVNNYAAAPAYVALSCAPQPPALRYEVRRLGGHLLYL